jgi:hypothetical protein
MRVPYTALRTMHVTEAELEVLDGLLDGHPDLSKKVSAARNVAWADKSDLSSLTVMGWRPSVAVKVRTTADMRPQLFYRVAASGYGTSEFATFGVNDPSKVTAAKVQIAKQAFSQGQTVRFVDGPEGWVTPGQLFVPAHVDEAVLWAVRDDAAKVVRKVLADAGVKASVRVNDRSKSWVVKVSWTDGLHEAMVSSLLSTVELKGGEYNLCRTLSDAAVLAAADRAVQAPEPLLEMLRLLLETPAELPAGDPDALVKLFHDHVERQVSARWIAGCLHKDPLAVVPLLARAGGLDGLRACARLFAR